MAGIRQTIELLLKILHYNGISKVKSESLRLAKLNSNEAAIPLWKLLFELLYYVKYDAVDDVTVKAYSELTKQELAVYVKSEMKLRGFLSKDFHSLPTDMTSGSRELLLAVGWLLCHCNVLQLFMKNCSSPITMANSDDHTQAPGAWQSLEKLSATQSLSTEGQLKHLKWLNGKLRMSLRQLHIVQQEQTKLTGTIGKATKGVALVRGRDHLTPLEAALLQSPELLQRNLKLLERDNARLECLLQWHGEHDDTFWKWMASVLDAKLAEGEHMSLDNELSPRYNTAAHRQLTDKVNLMDAVQNYEAIIGHIESLHRAQHPDALNDQLDSLLSSLELEIAMQKASIALSLEEQSVNADNHVNSAKKQTSSDGSTLSKLRHMKPRSTGGGGGRVTAAAGGQTTIRIEDSDDGLSVNSVHSALLEMNSVDEQLDELQLLIDKLQRDIEFKKRAYDDDVSRGSGCEEVLSDVAHFRS